MYRKIKPNTRLHDPVKMNHTSCEDRLFGVSTRWLLVENLRLVRWWGFEHIVMLDF